MDMILVEHDVSSAKMEVMGVYGWPIWSKEVSEFPWTYDRPESCYFLEGDVIVTPEGGEPIQMGEGDFVTFPKGMTCTWQIKEDVKKHYTFK